MAAAKTHASAYVLSGDAYNVFIRLAELWTRVPNQRLESKT